MNHKLICILLAAVMLFLSVCGCTPQKDDMSSTEPAADAVIIQTNMDDPAEAALFLADDTGHPALMTVMSDGAFHPDAPITKAELCMLLYPLFDGLQSGRSPFTDVESGDDCCRAVSALAAAELLPDRQGGDFQPQHVVSRSYGTEVLQRIADGLGGEDAERARLVAIDMAAGLTAGGDELPSETSWLSRSETAVLLERLLGREPDERDLFMNGCLPPDADPADERAYIIADALTDGVPQPVTGGVHRLYGWLYAAWDDGSMITNMDYGVWSFGPDGRYTTGSAELDGYLAEALQVCGSTELDDEQALQAAYLYVKYNFEYLVRPEDMETIPVGVTGWEYERAERFFRYGGGTCYGYAAAFCLMARALGQHAYAVAAQINQFYGAHGFVVIPEGETDIIYDVEMEATRPERHQDLDLFGIENYSIYNYWYVANWRIE